MKGSRKRILLLVGPKGAGKSFLGSLIERDYGIRFLRVESWVKALDVPRDIDDPAYLQAVFDRIEAGVREALERSDAVVFETTGLTDACERMIARLRSDFRVTTIGVRTDPTLCLRRVRERDRSIHIDVSDEDVERVNAAVAAHSMPTDFRIDGSDRPAADLSADIGTILTASHP